MIFTTKRLLTSVVAFSLLMTASSNAALTLNPLASFGGGDGWLSPDESAQLSTSNTQRGLTYNSANNHLYVVDRDGGTSIHILDGDTGAPVGTLDNTGISGGTFPLNMIDVADDGAIYAANLEIGADFKVYRWADEASAPTVAFDAASGLSRTGDTFAVMGAGTNTQLIASGSGADGFARFTTGDGVNFSGGAQVVTGAPSGAFRLGLDFVSANTVIGKQTGPEIYDVGVGGGSANTNSVLFQSEAPLAYYQPQDLLATVAFDSSDVRLYDASDLSALNTTGFQDIANSTSAFVTNGNGVGDLKFGQGPDGGLRLYALNTNNGIQAFAVIPEPASIVLFALGLVPTLLRRR